MIRYEGVLPAPAYLTILAVCLVCALMLLPGRNQASRIEEPGPPLPAATLNVSASRTGLPDHRPLDGLSVALMNRPLVLDGRKLPTETPPLSQTVEAPVEPETATAKVPQAQPPAPSLRYMGYFKSGKAPKALIAWGQDSPEAEWRAEGYEQDGWRIKAIERDQLTMSNGTDELTFGLYTD